MSSTNERPGSGAEAAEHVLRVDGLKTYFSTDEGVVRAVDGISFDIRRGSTLGLVGESGCGKSVAALSILRIVPPTAQVTGSVLLNARSSDGASHEVDLVGLDASGSEIRSYRGREIAMIFQEPMTSFSPLHTIGFQIMESLLLHRTRDPEEARDLTLELLTRVGVPDPAQRIDAYPHQLSGGLRQRGMIAMALSCNPALLIADEPTTALDVTVQAQVLELMKELQREEKMAILFITHNLGVIAEMAQEVAVMYLGQIVEQCSVDDLFFDPLHPYTAALLRSIPHVGRKARVRLQAIDGSVPVPIDLPPGCSFFPRCPRAMGGKCDTSAPSLLEAKAGHAVRCLLYAGPGQGDTRTTVREDEAR